MTTHPQQPENMSNEDIIAVALRIREEDTRQVKVRPWKSRHRTAWYIAVPAACLVSFFLGYLLKPSNEAPQGLASITTDTVYVQQVVYDTIYQTTDVHKPVRPRPITASNESEPRKIGVSVLEDNIRYDLLASNGDMFY
ncbi:MAG: hypothetical protein J6Y38_05355 [Bacteroidaceae bacterium]|nr:hypothetical protein [Bacteroidaceae bacterium]